jgi:ubiquinone biosynthesis accessory factor UbiJ
MDAMFSTAAIVSAEKIINAALVYDPGTRIALKKLAPQVLSVELIGTGIHFFLVPSSTGVNLLGHFEGDVSAHLSGTVHAFFSLLSNEQVNLKNTGISVTGNASFVAELQKVLKQTDIDWEEIICEMFGDLLGHQLARTARSKMSWLKQRSDNLQRLTSEFLTEESGILPSKPEVNNFNQQVDNIRFSVDRLEARVNQLTHSLKPLEGTHKK